MKNRLTLVLLGFALALCAAVAIGSLVQDASAQDSGRQAVSSSNDVVMVRCAVGASGFKVATYQGSVTAPAKRSDDCPQTLALLGKDGFRIRSIGYSQEADFIIYTLMR